MNETKSSQQFLFKSIKQNGEERYFICNNATEMDDIDEVSKKEFVSHIKRFLK